MSRSNTTQEVFEVKRKYSDFIRVDNLCVFRSKYKAVYVNIDLHLIQPFLDNKFT